jgi:hypothetical protein
MSEVMAKAVCAQVTQDIVSITPQLDDDDYTCPICSTICWRPIRLSCSHVLCSKCAIELQRTYKYDCPICRAKKVVKEANEGTNAIFYSSFAHFPETFKLSREGRILEVPAIRTF